MREKLSSIATTSEPSGTAQTLNPGSDELSTESRRSFLHRSAMVTAAGTAAVIATSRGGEAANNSLNVLPRLYPGWNAKNFSSIRQHENDHVAFLQNVLGGNGFADPGFVGLEQPNALAFARLSRVFENTGTATYLGAAPLIFNPTNLAAAASIALVEARHSGYLNTLLNFHINDSVVAGAATDESFESPQSPVATAQAIAPFLANPALGMELATAISTTPSPANDIAIFRFALALEYLERDYYNINVPKFLHVMG